MEVIDKQFLETPWYGSREVFNSDQGSQFTSGAWIGVLIDAKTKIRIDEKAQGAILQRETFVSFKDRSNVIHKCDVDANTAPPGQLTHKMTR